MQVILKEIVIPSLVVLFKAVYVVLICYRFNYPNKKTRNVMTALSIAFPIITGIVCIVKYRRSKKRRVGTYFSVHFICSGDMHGKLFCSNQVL